MDEYNRQDEDPISNLIDLVIFFRPLYIKLPLFNKIRQMTYKNAVEYFIENKPPIPFEFGAMILEHNDGSGNAFFVQVFLDKNNSPVVNPVTQAPYGRRCLIRGMDDELIAAFGDKQVVIVK